MNTIQIKDKVGRIIAIEEHMDNGDIIVKNYYGKILGKYIKSSNTTVDFCGRLLAYEDAHGSLININS